MNSMTPELNQDNPGNGFVDVVDEGRLRYVTICRESRANALSVAMLGSLADAIASAGRVSAIDAIVLRSTGVNFCAGADMGELRTHRRQQYDALRTLIAALDKRAVPLLCVMQGRALGAGCVLSALADVVIASDEATQGFPEMRFGMYPSLVHAVLVQKLPEPLVYALCVGARVLSAHDAWSLGLVTEVLPADDFTKCARDRVEFYVARTAAIRYGREMMDQSAREMLLARVAKAEHIIDRNLADPEVEAMLSSYRK
jgi:enoyl-CoA hydratase/carnithine racemase